MATNMERLAAAFFENKDDATRAIAALRQAGLAQIGVASHDDSQERKLSEKTATQPGVAVSPNVGPRLERTDQDSDYASITDIQGTLLAAGMSPHQADYFRDRLEHNGVLVTAAAPAHRWAVAQQTLRECGGDTAAEIPNIVERSTETTTVVTPIPPAPVEPSPRQPARVASNIPNPGQQGTVTVKREPGTPQSDFEQSSGMGPIELRGTLRDLHRERKPRPGEKAA